MSSRLLTLSFAFAWVIVSGAPAASRAQSIEQLNTCKTTSDDPCLRVGTCSIQGATWPQEVHVDRADIFDTQGWPGLCDMVHVSLVQGECFPGGTVDVIAQLSTTSYAWISEISGPLDCSGPTVPVCNDGYDNDGDGLIDLPEDPGCVSADDFSERAACGDRVDNDLDGAVDHPEDVGCANPDGRLEDPQCQDGLDNDLDGLIDFDGGEAAGLPSGGAEPDPQCAEAWRNREKRRSCGLLGIELLAPALILGARRSR